MWEKLKGVGSQIMAFVALVLTVCVIVIAEVVGFAVVLAVIIFLVWEILKWFGLF